MKTILTIIFILMSSLFFSQYITGLSATQNGENQIKTNLKVYLPTVGEFKSYSVNINQNVITLSTCYFMTDFGAISNLENDFYINIPTTPSNYKLVVNIYVSYDPTTCDYINLEDTKTLDFTTPIEGTVSMTTSENNNDNKSITLYPNPANKTLNFDAPFLAEQINVYDSTGKKAMTIQNPKVNKLDTSSLPNGIYHLEIFNNKNKYTKKFIIKKQ